jgi:hypothetical protein
MAKETPKLHAVENPETTPTPDDPFDLANLRLGQSFVENAGVKSTTPSVCLKIAFRELVAFSAATA